MRWQRGRRSTRVEDRRGMGGRGAAVGAGVGLPVLLAIVVTMCLGGGGDVDLGAVLAQLEQAQQAPPGAAPEAPIDPADDPDAELVEFVSFVLDDAQATWEDLFAGAGLDYEPTTLVLYERGTPTGCGYGSAAVGPFYCPADAKVYLDLSFFRELRDRFDAPGDFAQAYVIAHEVAHHVQNQLGISSDVRAAQQDDPGQANALSVALELQADCFSGVWAHSTYDRDVLEQGDLQEGLDAAAAIGDDAIQEQQGRRVNPETWTHGSSEQRVRWFTTGFESGDPDACDTFA